MVRGLREKLRDALMRLRILYLNKVWGHHIAGTARISFSAFLDRTSPELVFIGEHSIITRGVLILSHDFSRGLRAKTSIGANCLIGSNSIILPGVSVGDGSVIGAGAVVANDVPPGSLVAGNPAKVLRQITTGPYGRILK